MIDIVLERNLPNDEKDEAEYELPIIDRCIFGRGSRDEGVDFTLRNSKGTSRRHFVVYISKKTRKYIIKDIGSKYGTFLNDIHIDSYVELHNRVEITAGVNKFRVEISYK